MFTAPIPNTACFHGGFMALPRFSRAVPFVGRVVYDQHRPATPLEVWMEVNDGTAPALNDLLLIDSPRQQILAIVADIQVQARRQTSQTSQTSQTNQPTRVQLPATYARLTILSISDGRQRPPDGTVVRQPTPAEVTDLLAEARQIPEEYRVPLAVVPLRSGFAPVHAHLKRLVGPTATSMLITGAAGSLKSTAGVLLMTSIARVTDQQAALVLVNSKGNDFLFADYARREWTGQAGIPPLREHDEQLYTALGFPEPPTLAPLTAFVPQTDDPTWQSARVPGFPNTQNYALSQNVAIRYACAPNDDDERATSIITRQCIEEVAGSFAQEMGITTLQELVHVLEAELLALSSERARWRGQFQGSTLGAALRQLRSAVRDLGPLLSPDAPRPAFPVHELAHGGTWVVDIAPLPQRAAQAVLDELINALWQAKARETIPNTTPLVLLVDELNRWSTTGPTAARLAAIVRDQRHRRFSLVGLAQQLSTLHPQLLANAESFWFGTTRSQEASQEVYNYLPIALRNRLHRLPPGQRVLDIWPLAQPLPCDIPFPSWLIADEGLAVVAAWRGQGRG